MAEELDLVERIQLAIRVGESHFREFKSGCEGPPDSRSARPIRDLMVDVARTLVGFANADGGELLIGVEDDGTVSGLAHPEKDIALLLRAPISHVHAETPLPTPRAATAEIDGKKVVYLGVCPSNPMREKPTSQDAPGSTIARSGGVSLSPEITDFGITRTRS